MTELFPWSDVNRRNLPDPVLCGSGWDYREAEAAERRKAALEVLWANARHDILVENERRRPQGLRYEPR